MERITRLRIPTLVAPVKNEYSLARRQIAGAALSEALRESRKKALDATMSSRRPGVEKTSYTFKSALGCRGSRF